ncbi:HAD-IIA family hydrolase [Anaerorhabdus furcosa]|uniref:4-nitrophenyl phosphatase n=1 Tax=Anaerorhabdus furcosa TaxID=118967 RepID=A0A1T4QBI3_9FIRM|nr:HAD-IIA family hydrolase [Anaerorhabdus furcosa]SKA00987.1 4-nitrophenyl phosphatase [Anaerorhabdus furcosa]
MDKKCYFIDLDGTMYWGTKVIDGAIKWINYLLDNHIDFYFLTNNSSRTQEQACQHMQKMGFTGIKPHHFYTSAMAAAEKIARDYPSKKDAYYIGEEGLKQALISNGFTINPEKADFLFIGLDRQATYQDYSYAVRLVKDGCKLVGTNNDRLLLSEKGVNIGNGSVVAMFEYATSSEAIKIGKPHNAIIEGALRYAKVAKENAVIVGDNLETDILCGNQAGIETIFVTTGVHNMEDCYKLDIKPTYIVANLKGLID